MNVNDENKNYKFIINVSEEIELINYVNLCDEEKILVLKMRNHKEIKKWMLNQTTIEEKKHSSFIQKLQYDLSRKYFIVKFEKNIIGSINFSNIISNSSAEFGLFVNPYIKFRGAGKLLSSASSYYASKELNVNKLNLQVLSNNERAINFYKNCGFKLFKKKTMGFLNIEYMEKKIVEGFIHEN